MKDITITITTAIVIFILMLIGLGYLSAVSLDSQDYENTDTEVKISGELLNGYK